MKIQNAQPGPPPIPKTASGQSPAIPPAAMPLKRRSPVADRLTASELLFRIVIVAFLTGSLLLAWWSFSYVLATPAKERAKLSEELRILSREVDELEREWTPEQQTVLDKKFALASSMFFTEDLTSWAGNLAQHASKLNLRLSGGEISHNLDTNLGISKLSVRLEVMPQNVPELETSYHRFLRLSQHLVTPGTRFDMPELTVSGGSNSVNRAYLVLDLWTNSPGDIQ
jgi:hypothetical protein